MVTIHYIDADWKINAFALQTLPFPERHTGVLIAEKLKDVAERWDIVEKVVAILHDQGMARNQWTSS